MLLIHDDDTSVGALAVDGQAEALFREARRRQRRRWAVRVVAAIAIAAVIGTIGLALAASDRRPTDDDRGSGAPGFPLGAFATLRTAGPLAVAGDGALYVADTAGHRVLVLMPDGGFRVIAGTGRAGFSGDGGPATRARLSVITDLAMSPAGSLYIADGGRVRVVEPDGVIHTIAGDGHRTRHIARGTPALTAPIGSPRSVSTGESWLTLALGPHGRLFISTGSQVLRLTGRQTLAPVRARMAGPPPWQHGLLQGFGPIAVDRRGNIDVSGVNGWAVWQVASDGTATEVGDAAGARRSGGDYSVLERGPGGSVYAEDGPTLLRVEGHRLVPVFRFNRRIAGEYFWLDYFALGPHGRFYADELPGGNGFEARQQLISRRGGHEALLWEQPKQPTH